MAIPIQNGSSIPLTSNSGTLPNMSTALTNWFQLMNFIVVTKTTPNFQVVETTTTINFQGVIQPFTDRQLLMKDIGERKWSWYMVHAEIGTVLNVDDQVTYLGVTYRVMSQKDYTPYGYLEYHLILDYVP